MISSIVFEGTGTKFGRNIAPYSSLAGARCFHPSFPLSTSGCTDGIITQPLTSDSNLDGTGTGGALCHSCNDRVKPFVTFRLPSLSHVKMVRLYNRAGFNQSYLPITSPWV